MMNNYNQKKFVNNYIVEQIYKEYMSSKANILEAIEKCRKKNGIASRFTTEQLDDIAQKIELRLKLKGISGEKLNGIEKIKEKIKKEKIKYVEQSQLIFDNYTKDIEILMRTIDKKIEISDYILCDKIFENVKDVKFIDEIKKAVNHYKKQIDVCKEAFNNFEEKDQVEKEKKLKIFFDNYSILKQIFVNLNSQLNKLIPHIDKVECSPDVNKINSRSFARIIINDCKFDEIVEKEKNKELIKRREKDRRERSKEEKRKKEEIRKLKEREDYCRKIEREKYLNANLFHKQKVKEIKEKMKRWFLGPDSYWSLH